MMNELRPPHPNIRTWHGRTIEDVSLERVLDDTGDVEREAGEFRGRSLGFVRTIRGEEPRYTSAREASLRTDMHTTAHAAVGDYVWFDNSKVGGSWGDVGVVVRVEQSFSGVAVWMLALDRDGIPVVEYVSDSDYRGTVMGYSRTIGR